MNVFKKTILAATAAFVLALGANAHALTISVDDGSGAHVTVGAGPIVSTGSITYNGWDFSITGTTTTNMLLDTNTSIESTLGGVLPLTITITDTQVGPLLGLATSSWTPTTILNGDVTFDSFVDGTLVASVGPLSSGGGTFGGSALVAAGNPYTIKHVYTITPTGPGSAQTLVTGDSVTSVSPIPEPGTMLLMGSGLLGLGLWRKFKK